MKSFVVLSYYQLSHAVAMALDMEEKGNLYFSTVQSGVTAELLERIRATGVFNEVVEIDNLKLENPLTSKLKLLQNSSDKEIEHIGNRLFEKHIVPYCERVFSGADFQDDLYLYNDFQPYYYYIAGHFSHIIGVEDAYGVLEKQMNLINHTGIEAFHYGQYKSRFVGKYWPEMQWKNSAVKTVLSSVPLTEEAPAYLKEKVRVLDYYELVNRHPKEHREVLESIFGVVFPDFIPESSLILTQPLSANRYCTALDQFLFHRKLILEELEHSQVVYVKPHPADRTDYSVIDDERVIVLEKRFPVELLCDRNVEFRRVVSMMSTATGLLKAEKHVQFIDKLDADRQDIADKISEYIAEESVQLDLYVRVRECTPEVYVNVYLLCRKAKQIDYRIHVLLEGIPEEERQYFSFRYADERVQQYLEEKALRGEPVLWEKEIRKIPKLKQELLTEIEIAAYEDGSDHALVRMMAETEGDFAFLMDAHNMGHLVRKDLLAVLRKEIVKSVKVFPGHTIAMGVRYELGTGASGTVIDNRLSNRLFHKAFLRQILESDPNAFDNFCLLSVGSETVGIFARNNLFVAEQDCALLREEEDSLQRRLQSCTTTDEVAAMIKAIQIWRDARNQPVSGLMQVLQESGLEQGLLAEGLCAAFANEIMAQKRERSRFLYKKELELRYCNEEVMKTIPQRVAECGKESRSIAEKIKRRIKKK